MTCHNPATEPSALLRAADQIWPNELRSTRLWGHHTNIPDGTVVAPRGLCGEGVRCPGLCGIPPFTWADAAGYGDVMPCSGQPKGLLMRLGFTPFRGSNPRASAARRPSPWMHGRGPDPFGVTDLPSWWSSCLAAIGGVQ